MAQMQQQMQQQQQQQKMMVPQPDPMMQAVIEASFVPVDLVFGPPENVTVLCEKHSLEKCVDCDADYTNLNRLSRLLQMNPNLRCPPPPQMLSQKLSGAITNTKEEGNVRVHRLLALIHASDDVYGRSTSRPASTRRPYSGTRWLLVSRLSVLPGKLRR